MTGLRSHFPTHTRAGQAPQVRPQLPDTPPTLPVFFHRMEIYLPGWTSTTVLEAKLYWTLAPLGSSLGTCVAEAPGPTATQTPGPPPSLPIQSQLDGLQDNPRPLTPYLPVNKVLSTITKFRQAPLGSLSPALKPGPGSSRLVRFLQEELCSTSRFPVPVLCHP